MPVSDDYAHYVLDQLHLLGRVSARRMFGGMGLYHGDWFFALIANNVLYFKADDYNRPAYQRAGMQAFKPYAVRATRMSYFEVPPEVVEDPETLSLWAKESLRAAREAKRRSRR